MQALFDAVNAICEKIQVVSDLFWDFPTNLDWYAAIPILGNFSLAIILLVGTGVSFEVTADVVTMAGEGVALALCKVFGLKFPVAKVGVDCAMVICAIILGFVFLHQLSGVREGTVAAAIFVGMTARQVNKPMKRVGQLVLV